MDNLAELIETKLPPELVKLAQKAAAAAGRRKEQLYLVGGVVRDLLLGTANFDLDLVVEGDAVNLAKELVKDNEARLTTHQRFNTARLKFTGYHLDIATARSETYARPGALPAVKPGTLKDDLVRRDFTINAMAVRLSPPRYGELVDLYGGRQDLGKKLIRVLHDRSFIDDATRIWRAIRYEQRLGFRIEEKTLRLLKQDISYLQTISGDRVRHELEMVLKEKEPEKMLARAAELGALAKIHTSLRGDGWLKEKYRAARRRLLEGHQLLDLYFALLTYRLDERENEELISFLHPVRHVAAALRDTNQLKSSLGELEDPEISRAQIFSLLHGYALTAIQANYIAMEPDKGRKAIDLYLRKLRTVKPLLTGNDLLKMGIKPGPRMQEVLIALHEAKLNGETSTRAEEEALVGEWVFRTNG